MRGPMTFPSNCCSMMINTKNARHFDGDTSRIKNALGIAPIKGPNIGMILVTPTMTLTSSA